MAADLEMISRCIDSHCAMLEVVWTYTGAGMWMSVGERYNATIHQHYTIVALLSCQVPHCRISQLINSSLTACRSQADAPAENHFK